MNSVKILFKALFQFNLQSTVRLNCFVFKTDGNKNWVAVLLKINFQFLSVNIIQEKLIQILFRIFEKYYISVAFKYFQSLR